MKKLIVLILVIFSLSLALNTQVVADKSTGKASKVQVLGSGSTGTGTLSSNTDGNLVLTGAGWYTIDTYATGASGALDTISGCSAGDVIILQTTVDGRDITLDETDNIILGASTRALSDTDDKIILMFDGTSYIELGFADNS